MKTVKNLTRAQLDELKQSYMVQLHEDADFSYQELSEATNIPDNVIFNHYEGIMFTDDDFFCSLKED